MKKWFYNNKEVNGLKEKYESEINELHSKIKEIQAEKDEFEHLTGEFQKEADEKLAIADEYQSQNEETKKYVANAISNINITMSSLASGAEELTATNEEITATMSEISERVNHAYESAKQNGNIMNEFNEEIIDTTNDFYNLQKEIGSITKIVEVIKQISEQSNLLGLNASIESARAGDVGKGFGVVATEIRKLAESTKESSLDIEKIIKEIQKKTTDMIEKVNKCKENSNKLLEENIGRISNIEVIDENIKDVAQNMSNSSSAQQEQTSNFVEVSNEIDKLDNYIK